MMKLPRVDAVLVHPELAAHPAVYALKKRAVQLRLAATRAALDELLTPRPRAVINATGVLLHTNLARTSRTMRRRSTRGPRRSSGCISGGEAWACARAGVAVVGGHSVRDPEPSCWRRRRRPRRRPGVRGSRRASSARVVGRQRESSGVSASRRASSGRPCRDRRWRARSRGGANGSWARCGGSARPSPGPR